ncbi:MAG: SusC/RagA family TonB-linked outer membrane protein [Gemmatimonadales bacterium]|nr:SusC/RagA family TonB-linked outer membrane protein [Gemmatimonadales bacterium]
MKLRVFGLALLAALVSLPGTIVAQMRQVSGTVTRAGGGQPVAEALITVVGGRGIARTTTEGRFTINVPDAGATLSVRAIGFKSKEVIVKPGDNNLTVQLVEDAFKLEEVVTTGQATTLSRANATTAVSTVNSEEITRAPAQSLEQALQGKVLGASINMNSGAPGGGGQIQIRGVTSILGAGQPLIVVDGVIISNDAFSSGANAVTGAAGNTGAGGGASNQDAVVNRLADINPAEIESIEVLKSAAATAIYGSRATNGVVVIRTKRGTPGKARFNITQRVGTQNQLRSLGTRTFDNTLDVYNLPYGNGANGDAVAYLNSTFGGNVANGVGAPIRADQNFDLEKLFYSNNKPQYETQANYSGGDENTSYFVGATHRQETGLATRTGARLQSLRVNVDQQFSAKFKASAGLNVTRNVLNRGLSNNDNTCTSPVYCFGYTPGVIDLRQRNQQGQFIRNPFNGGGNATSNPFETFEFLTATEDVFRQSGSSNLAYTFVNSEKNRIQATFAGGFDRFTQQGTVISPSFLQFEGGNDGLFGRNQYASINSFNYNLNANVVWTYTGKPQDWSITTNFGAAYEEQNVNSMRARGRSTVPVITIINQGVQDQFQNITKFRDQAVYLNAQILALKEKLSLTGGFRADQSSANGNPGTLYLFPRIAASYRIEGIGPFDNLKIRGGYGQTGNRPRFGDRDQVFNLGAIIGGRPSIVAPGVLGNPAIKPETVTEFEGGFDATLLKERVQFELTYYDRKISDQLLQPPTPLSSGIGALVINGGELSNRGWEVGATFVPVNTGTLTWTSRATWQKNVQKVTSLPATVPPFAAANSFGAAFGRNRITVSNPAGAAQEARTTSIWGNAPISGGQIQVPGFCITNGGCSSRDTIIGDANPNFQMFFVNTLQYKRLSLAFTVDWRKGGDLVNLTQVLFDEGGTARDYTVSSGVVTNGGGLDGRPLSDFGNRTLGEVRYDAWAGGGDARVFVQDGSFVRLRDVQVSYDAPNSLAKTFGASSVRFNVQARNVFLSTNYWSYDPEFNNFGNQNLNRFIDLAPFPPARSFNFSVDVGF